MAWQPIETAPKNILVIIGREGAASEQASWLEVEGASGWYSTDSFRSNYNPWRAFPPTHWMPLPAPPSHK